MVKHILIILLTISFVNISYANEIDDGKAINCEEKQGDHIEFKYGVAIQNGKPLYIDPDKMEGVTFIISEKSIKNSKNDILKNSKIHFIEGGEIWVYDSKKDDPYFQIVDSMKEYFYKIEDNKMLISKDKNIWEEVNVRIVSINDEKSSKDREAPVYMTIYLESKYFKGEYDLIGTPDSEPF